MEAPIPDCYGDWTLEQMRLVCTARKHNEKKNTSKNGRVKPLPAYDENKTSVELLLQRQSCNSWRLDELQEKRTKNCMFRLLNVLFSDG
ncbi:hypothetical protein P3T76_004073 [Phytophthora citrophthora]|uniref:Uncharacterized protein n=1 Tax=Phytophthora citrophthora TaxID=4793 RepID=A0AAD9GU71_9STRA|nr:hypothetical protein P3T76_004073 [Phytophthora citrophthora]